MEGMESDKSALTSDYSPNQKFYFSYFKGFQDLKEKSEKYIAEKRELTPNFFKQWDSGRPGSFEGSSDKDLLDAGNFLEYIDKPALEATMNSFDDLMVNVDMGGAFIKSKIIFTEDKKGIFDFSLASRGLYALQEFYSQELADKKPFEFPVELPGIVPPIYVDKNEMGDYWYTSSDGEKFQCQKQDNGTKAFEMKIPGAKKKYATTTKKSYIMFEKKGGKSKMVDLYVGVGGLGSMQATGMMGRAMPLLLAARYFEQAGIRTRVNAVRMSSDSAGFYVADAWTVKDYGDDIDFNFTAINVADPRFFRWNLWKYCRAILWKNHGITENWGGGRTVYGGATMRETGDRYKNWYFEQMEQGKIESVPIDRNLMIFGGVENPNDTYDIRKSSDKRMTDDIVKEFYRILDIVDFQFNKPEYVVKRLYERMVENDKKSVREFKNYVQNILSQAYSYPIKGMYATESKRIEQLNEEYDNKIDSVNTYLRSLTT